MRESRKSRTAECQIGRKAAAVEERWGDFAGTSTEQKHQSEMTNLAAIRARSMPIPPSLSQIEDMSVTLSETESEGEDNFEDGDISEADQLGESVAADPLDQVIAAGEDSTLTERPALGDSDNEAERRSSTRCQFYGVTTALLETLAFDAAFPISPPSPTCSCS